MGTYLDAFIEIDLSDESPSFNDPILICSLNEGSFLISSGARYPVFDALAYGRSASMDPEDQDPDRKPKFPPRGMPTPQSSEVAQHYYRLVADVDTWPNSYFWPAHRCITPVAAKELLQTGKSSEAQVYQWFNCPAEGLYWRVVSEPHFYNASWLWPHEFDQALAHHQLELPSLPVEFSIIRTAMAMLEKDKGAGRVRLVIWFS